MNVLHWFESIRMPVLNEFMQGITYFGDEVVFLAIAVIMLWCVDKRRAYFIFSVGFIGTISNQFLKLCFRIPRPWIVDPTLQPMGQALERAAGYSFPSGHTQAAVGTFGAMAYTARNKLLRILCIVIAVLVPVSRLYLGVHTLLDVAVAAGMAVVFVFVFRPVVMAKDGKYFPIMLGVMAAVSIGYLCFVHLFPFPADVDPERVHSGVESAYTMIGCMVGLLIVYIVDEKWLHFPVKGVWWVQILKVAIGIGLLLAIKIGLKIPLNHLFGEYIGRSARYFLIVIMAGTIWPLSFKLFSKIGVKE